jgi:hypothetical protein
MARRLGERSRSSGLYRLDLHFAPFDRAHEVTQLPGDLAVLMGGIAARQAASATAQVQARLWLAADPLLFRPLHGAFHGAMAMRVAGWIREGAVYPKRSADLQAGKLLPATNKEGAASPEGLAQ